MSRRYDQSTTTFSPDGRLHQVEYAMEAINNAGTCVGLQSENGISKNSEKTYVLDNHAVCLVAGLTADANILTQNCRLQCQRYQYKFGEPVPMEQLVKELCNYKQQYTQFGGLRPFGVSFVFAGWDKHHGYQLYQSDPSGNYSGWKATVIGQNSQAGKSILKTDYKENAEQKDNLKLAVKILLKTMDATAPSPERIDLSEMKRTADGNLVHVRVSDEVVKELIDICQKEAEAEAKTSGDI
eukprot:GSChrysophyteH1.ASY1.ANO1.2478.1 assembled CDS